MTSAANGQREKRSGARHSFHYPFHPVLWLGLGVGSIAWLQPERLQRTLSFEWQHRLFTVSLFFVSSDGQPSWFYMYRRGGRRVFFTIIRPPSTFDIHPQAKLGTFETKMAARCAKSSISTILRKKQWAVFSLLVTLCEWLTSSSRAIKNLNSTPSPLLYSFMAHGS